MKGNCFEYGCGYGEGYYYLRGLVWILVRFLLLVIFTIIYGIGVVSFVL